MKIVKSIKGLADPITLVVIVACFVIGGLYMAYSKKVDAPLEQVAEAVLDSQGIDVDFSAGKKDAASDSKGSN